MKLKKLAAFAVTVLMAISALSITAFAADPIGTDPTTLTDGKKTSASIPYAGNEYYDNGDNYKDFKYTASSKGVLAITIDAAINDCEITVYRDDTKKKLDVKEVDTPTGKYTKIWVVKGFQWDGTAGLFATTLKYDVEKGDYIIRVARCFSHAGSENQWGTGHDGNGRVHITCEMDLPKAPTNIKLTSISGTSIKFTWTEPKGCTSYDLRYRLEGTEKWTIKKNINDNNVTVSGLKASKTYEYQMRSYSGKTVGNWGKTGKFKTSGAAYSGKLGVPSAKSVTIEWNAVENAASYEITYKVGNGDWTTKSVSSNSYTISVSSGKTYTYSIRAVNGSNKGEWSASKTINT